MQGAKTKYKSRDFHFTYRKDRTLLCDISSLRGVKTIDKMSHNRACWEGQSVRLTSPAGGRAGGRADVAATCADAASQEPGHAGGRADVAATGARRGRTRAAAHQLVRSA